MIVAWLLTQRLWRARAEKNVLQEVLGKERAAKQEELDEQRAANAALVAEKNVLQQELDKANTALLAEKHTRQVELKKERAANAALQKKVDAQATELKVKGKALEAKGKELEELKKELKRTETEIENEPGNNTPMMQVKSKQYKGGQFTPQRAPAGGVTCSTEGASKEYKGGQFTPRRAPTGGVTLSYPSTSEDSPGRSSSSSPSSWTPPPSPFALNSAGQIVDSITGSFVEFCKEALPAYVSKKDRIGVN